MNTPIHEPLPRYIWPLVPVVAFLFMGFALASYFFGVKPGDFDEGDED